ncbi:MAG: glycoside hydrolase family 2 protein [Candidatus Hydrogenedentales bacterium]
MKSISLDGTWSLTFFHASPDAPAHPAQLAEFDAASVPAHVPGNVELDLVRAGTLPEPFFGGNIRLLRPLETHEWWYAREFEFEDGPGCEDWDLVFEGLDTYATVWLNGVEIGRSDNMLIPHRFPASGALRPGANQVHVRIEPAVLRARHYPYDASMLSWEHRMEGLHVRKAPHMWGWDIMPRAVSAGIWRGVRLEPRPAYGFEQIYYRTLEADARMAVLTAMFEVRAPEPDLLGCTVEFEGVCGDHRFDYAWPLEFSADSCRICVPNARLWWPKGYGDPNLYTVTARLLRGGELLAQRIDRIGLRTVTLERSASAGIPHALAARGLDVCRYDEPPDPAGHFLFRVNDLPIQVRGTNWVPLDAFHSRDAERLADAMALADDLGCNMIRCWGGNVYEDPAFFEHCDEKGILVWQDFAFACCRYPQHEAFFERVRHEAETVVTRLRNHASLALWCGDNEIDECYASDGLSPAQNRISREVLPQVVHRCDPGPLLRSQFAVSRAGSGRANSRSSISGGRGVISRVRITPGTRRGLSERSDTTAARTPRPSGASSKKTPGGRGRTMRNGGSTTYRTCAITRSIATGSSSWPTRSASISAMCPSTLEAFVLASQIVQAEAKKYFIESTRQRKWRTSGILWWNLLDGWPQFSDAVVDYYFGKKLAYWYIRRVQPPVCVMLGDARRRQVPARYRGERHAAGCRSAVRGRPSRGAMSCARAK